MPKTNKSLSSTLPQNFVTRLNSESEGINFHNTCMEHQSTTSINQSGKFLVYSKFLRLGKKQNIQNKETMLSLAWLLALKLRATKAKTTLYGFSVQGRHLQFSIQIIKLMQRQEPIERRSQYVLQIHKPLKPYYEHTCKFSTIITMKEKT